MVKKIRSEQFSISEIANVNNFFIEMEISEGVIRG